MELIALFFLSFGVGFSGAMMPGPVLAVSIAETPRSGWKTGPIISIGHAIAEIAVVVILSLGLVTISDDSIIPSIIGIVGGIALILMGIMMGIDIIRGGISYDSGEKASSHKLITKGITTSLSNPYWFVWWVTTGLAFLTKSLKFGVIGPVVFYFGHIMSDFVWYTIVTVILWKGKKLIVGKGLKILILVCSAFLLYLGGWFIYDGMQSIQ